jgi:phosphatidylglycerophosphatase A
MKKRGKKLDKKVRISSVFESFKSLAKASIIVGFIMGIFYFIEGLFLKNLLYAVIHGVVSGAIFGILVGIALALFLFIFRIKALERFLFYEYRLNKGEVVFDEIFANHSESNQVAGGKILLTNKGLWFIPHIVNFSTKSFFIPYRTITYVGISKRDFNPVTGGLVKRLEIVANSRHFFVVNKKEKIVEYLNLMRR